MKILEESSPKQSIPNWLILAFLAVSFLGFLDATYLSAQHYLGAVPPCVITAGCETVLTSDYSAIFGVPVALVGAAYYILIFFLAILSFDVKRGKIIRFLAFLTPIGFLASLYFVYLQLFIIKEICFYCVISAATSTILFLLGLFIPLEDPHPSVDEDDC